MIQNRHYAFFSIHLKASLSFDFNLAPQKARIQCDRFPNRKIHASALPEGERSKRRRRLLFGKTTSERRREKYTSVVKSTVSTVK
jgi:hypothetical protein